MAGPEATDVAAAVGPLAGAGAVAPQIAQVNVSNNSRLHVGPQFVAVTQNVHHDRVVKGSVLGVAVEARGVSDTEGTRLRCGIAVCVCCALVAAAALATLAAVLALARRSLPLDLELREPWYLRRADWQAMPAFETKAQPLPVSVALVGHSVTDPCDDRYECTERVLEIQREHQRHGWADVGPNFLIGGGRDGIVLEGRGAGVLGVMLRGWNSRSVSIMFLGDFREGHDEPSPVALEHLRVLLNVLVAARVLHPQYVLLGQCQLAPWNYTPGVRLMRQLARLPHWDARNVTTCLQWSQADFPDLPTEPP